MCVCGNCADPFLFFSFQFTHYCFSFSKYFLQDRVQKAGEFPDIEDGSDDIVDDVNLLLYVVEGVEDWLQKVMGVDIYIIRYNTIYLGMVL